MLATPRKVDANVLRVGIVGGSIGGLTTALLLRALGHDVDVFERATGELTGFGAGIVAHESLTGWRRTTLSRTSTAASRPISCSALTQSRR